MKGPKGHNYGRPRSPLRAEGLLLVSKGMSARAASLHLGLSDDTVGRWVREEEGRQKPKPYKKKTDRPAPHEKRPDPRLPEVLRLYAEGVRVEDLAKAFGKSPSRIWAWIRESKKSQEMVQADDAGADTAK